MRPPPRPPAAPRFRPAPFFLVRSPLLPEGTLAGLPAGAVRERLRALLANDVVRETLWWLSPQLLATVDAEVAPGPGLTEAELSLLRYVERLTSRCTPLGLAASLAVGRLGEASRLVLDGAPTRHTQVSPFFVTRVVFALEKDLAARRALAWVVNPSLRRGATQVHFVASDVQGMQLFQHARLADRSPQLDAVLARAANEAGFGELVDAVLATDGELERADAEGFLDEVLEQQLLVSTLRPPVTSGVAVNWLIDELTRRGLETRARPLREARAATEALRHQHGPQTVAALQGVAQSLQGDLDLPLPPMPTHMLFKADGELAMEPVLSRATAAELAGTLSLLARLGRDSPDERLLAFARLFRERYEDQEVPLAEVVHPERGLPASAQPLPPALASLPFSPERQGPSAWVGGHAARWLFDAVLGALQAGATELVLTPTDLERHAPPALPDSMAVTVRAECPPGATLDDPGARFTVISGSGPCGTRVLGRFSALLPGLGQALSRFAGHEGTLNPGVLFAEVVHQPADLADNIVLRAAIRDWEIPLMSRASVPASHQLPPEDLLVSVEGTRVRLRSRRLGREVVPRIASAHKAESDTTHRLYSLLAAIAQQGLHLPTLPLGALYQAPYLPRIRVGRVVLQRARWLVDAGFQERLRSAPVAARPALLEAERRGRRWPDRAMVAAHDSDQWLPVEFDQPESVLAAMKTFVSTGGAVLQEADLVGGPVEGPSGRHACELVLPLESTREPSPEQVPEPAPPQTRRRFSPASEWRFLKLYANGPVLERFLGEDVGHLLGERPRDWFFLFYADPQPHLRVRLHGPELEDAWRALLQRTDGLINEGLAWRAEVSTYQREVERYGGAEGIVLAERVFAADSALVATMFPRVPPADRWLLLLVGIDALWRGLGFSADQRLSMAEAQREAYAQEHGAGKALEGALSQLGRTWRQEVHGLLEGTSERGARLQAAFARREPLLREVAQALGAASLSRPIDEIARSYAHLSATRWLPVNVRATELAVYDLLERAYRSRARR